MDIAAWLRGLGLEQHERAFLDHDIDAEVLPELTAELAVMGPHGAVETLVPKGLMKCTSEEFLERLPEYDNAMLERFEAARAAGKVLRYVGRIDAKGTATVGLVQLDARHPFAAIALTDNVVRYATRRYCDNPLIVQGPGAGPEVTAGGVFSDLLRLCAYLGAKL